jgi:hypothetical protein
MDVVGAAIPELATTQPLFAPVNLRHAARVLVDAPIYLDNAGQLWVSEPGAQPLETVLQRAGDESVHLVPCPVVFVHYAADESGTVHPQPICRVGDAKFSLATQGGLVDLPESAGWDFQRGLDWTGGDAFAVPTAAGAVMVHVGPAGADGMPAVDVKTWQCKLAADATQKISTTQQPDQTNLALDVHGVIAWRARGGAARFVDGQWHDLDGAVGQADPEAIGWAKPILGLVPYLDGSVLRIDLDDQGQIALDVIALDHAQVPAVRVDSLIDDLSDPDPDRRNKAFDQLLRYHSAAWPELLKRQQSESPGANDLIGTLLHNKLNATLGQLTPNPGPAQVAARFGDGGVLLYLQAGVSLPTNPDAADAQNTPGPKQIIPAWVVVTPGTGATLLPSALTADLDLSRAPRLQHFGPEWVVADPVLGPCRLYGDQIKPILPREQIAFSELVGVDVQGRWLLRQSGSDRPTLVLDPALPDPSPRLPVWTLKVKGGRVGWDKANWPVVDKGGAFALQAEDWVRAKDGDGFFQTIAQTPTSNLLATFGPDLQSSVFIVPATQPATAAKSNFVLVENEKGQTSEIEVSCLPAGDWRPARLIRAAGRFFLFNQPGRVVRLKMGASQADRFTVDAIFTRGVPAPEHIERIWLDPAGRIDMVFDENQLAIMFPNGLVPPAIATKMPQDQLDEADESDSQGP